MLTPSYLPSWPLQLPDLGWAALGLLLAILLGEILQRLLRLPRITGYVIAGALLGNALAEAWTPDLLPLLSPLFELAFGLIVFELGQRIDLGWLRRNPWLLATSLAESLLAFGAVWAVLMLLQTPPLLATLTAGAAAATGPAVVLGVCKDEQARGPVTARLQLLCALGSCLAFVVLGVAFAWQHQLDRQSLSDSLAHPLYLLLGSALLGMIVARAISGVLSRLQARFNSQTLGVVGVLVFAASVASMLQLSVVVTLLAAGVLSRAQDRRHRLQPLDFGLIGRLALILVFMSSGALLKPEHLAMAIVPALGLIAARALGKLIGVFVFARQSGLSYRKASLLGVAMLPMSGAALLWVDRTAQMWPELGAQLAAIVLCALFIMELVSPPLTQFALRRADETIENQEAA